MGTGTLTVAVVDAGPIIHLAEVESLRFLDIFGKLKVPDAVWHETVGQKRVGERELYALHSLERMSIPLPDCNKFVQDNDLMHLHGGEQECLCLCRAEHIDTLLTDDLAVREATKRLGIQPVGSLGIIVSAFHTRQISLAQAELILHRLHRDSSLFVTYAIVELAIQQLHASSSAA